MPKKNLQKPSATKPKQRTASDTAKQTKRRFSRLSPLRLRRKKREKLPRPSRKLTGSFRLFADSMSLLRQHWKLFGGITLVYVLLNMILVGGFSSEFSIAELRQRFTEEFGQLSASLALFSLLISGSGNSPSESGAVYQTIVVLIVSLATIWALRQVLAGEKIKIRDAFYKGMYPLVPFVLVLLYLCLLFIPAVISGFIFNIVLAGGLAVTVLEQILWFALVTLLFSWTLYLLVTRIFAIYIVTLPDMRPVTAIKAARRLVYYRRWSVLRKLLFLPFVMLCIGAAVLLPLIAFAPVTVQWVFVVLSMFALVFSHTYAYSLYKELL